MEEQECECGHIKYCHTKEGCLKYSHIHDCDCKGFTPINREKSK